MKNEAKNLRNGCYKSNVSLQRGDNFYNTVLFSRNELANNVDKLYGLLAADYPNATWKIISHSDYKELPNICQNVWDNRFKRTTISQPTGFRLSIIEYSPTNVVAYIVLPEYH